MRRVTITLFVAASLITILLGETPAHATFPGKNGRIAFRLFLNKAHTWGAIFTIKPNGSGARQVTHPSRGVLDDAGLVTEREVDLVQA